MKFISVALPLIALLSSEKFTTTFAEEEEDASSIMDATEELTSSSIMAPFSEVGRGGCLHARGRREQSEDWNSMPNDKRTPEDCATLCLSKEPNALFKGFFGFDIGYGRCRCFSSVSGNSAYPVGLMTNGGYLCYQYDLQGLCEKGLPQTKLFVEE